MYAATLFRSKNVLLRTNKTLFMNLRYFATIRYVLFDVDIFLVSSLLTTNGLSTTLIQR